MERQIPLCTIEGDNKPAIPYASFTACHWRIQKYRHAVLRCIPKFSAPSIARYLLQGKVERENKLGKCGTERSADSRITGAVNLPGRLNVIREGTERRHPQHHPLLLPVSKEKRERSSVRQIP